MEAKLNVIAESAGVSLEEAQMALELADGDAEQALNLVPYVEKTIIVIHSRFSCGRNPKLHGVFRIVANGREGLILDLNLALSFNSAEVNASIGADPEAFGAIVQDLALKTDHGQAYSFKNGFYEQLGAAEINQIYQMIKDGEVQGVQELLYEIVGRVSPGSDKTVEVEVETHLLTKFQAEKKGLIEEGERAGSPEEGEDGTQLSMYLDAEPMISPVKGKTIDRFTVDEPLPLKITDNGEAGKYLGRILSNDSGIAVGRVKEYYLNEQSNRYQVTVEFGPKIMGRFRLDPNVRITSYATEPLEDSEAKSNASQLQVNTYLVVTGAIIVLVMMFYFFSR